MNRVLKMMLFWMGVVACTDGVSYAQNVAISHQYIQNKITQNVVQTNLTQYALRVLNEFRQQLINMDTEEAEQVFLALQKLAPVYGYLPEQEFAGLVTVGWDNYRTYTWTELFDCYVKPNHQDMTVALMEYQIKKRAVSEDLQNRSQIIYEQLPYDFYVAYAELSRACLQEQEPTHIIHALAKFAVAYNQLYQDDKELALSLKDSIFQLPLGTGWKKTTSVLNLYKDFCTFKRSGAEDYGPRTVAQFKKDGATEKEAKQLALFVRQF